MAQSERFFSPTARTPHRTRSPPLLTPVLVQIPSAPEGHNRMFQHSFNTATARTDSPATFSSLRSCSISSARSCSSVSNADAELLVEYLPSKALFGGKSVWGPTDAAAAVRIQKIVRGWIARRAYRTLQLEEDAECMFENYIERLQHDAATRIQRLWADKCRRRGRRLH
eukprot:NODE_3676_length_936_cov_31.438557_g3377_i0.p1 GENE.NODE_3676_length_936_cov_31.438557_g3377_i0~~NODE_3676_length_936_cov_31.438557_g3377_i0.p1  ORF type:complete len:169 (+),score=16.48 NODE_3676_length_936_cov_31.438557_g3377_i0:85-591(+)